MFTDLLSPTDKQHQEVNRKFPHVFLTTVWTGRELSSSCRRHVPVHSRLQEKAALPQQRQLSTHVQRSRLVKETSIIINKQWLILHHQTDAANQHHGREWSYPPGARVLLTNHSTDVTHSTLILYLLEYYCSYFTTMYSTLECNTLLCEILWIYSKHWY